MTCQIRFSPRKAKPKTKKQKKKALERAIREIEAYVDEDEVDLESEFWCEKRIQKMFHKWLKDDNIVEILFKDFGVENVEDQVIENGVRLFFRASRRNTRDFI